MSNISECVVASGPANKVSLKRMYKEDWPSTGQVYKRTKMSSENNSAIRRSNCFIGLEEFKKRTSTSEDRIQRSNCFIGFEEFSQRMGLASIEESAATNSYCFTDFTEFHNQATGTTSTTIFRSNCFVGLDEYNKRAAENTSTDLSAVFRSNCFIGIEEYNKRVGITSAEKTSKGGSNCFVRQKTRDGDEKLEDEQMSPTVAIGDQPIMRMKSFNGLQEAEQYGITSTADRTEIGRKRMRDAGSDTSNKRNATATSTQDQAKNQNRRNGVLAQSEAMKQKMPLEKLMEMEEAVQQWNKFFKTNYTLLQKRL